MGLGLLKTWIVHPVGPVPLWVQDFSCRHLVAEVEKLGLVLPLAAAVAVVAARAASARLARVRSAAMGDSLTSRAPRWVIDWAAVVAAADQAVVRAETPNLAVLAAAAVGTEM